MGASHLTPEEYELSLKRLIDLGSNHILKKESKYYRLIRKFDVGEVVFGEETIKKLLKKGTNLEYLKQNEIFDSIRGIHLSTGHGGRDIIRNESSKKYANLTKEIIQLYVDLCPTCLLKRSKTRKGIVVKPILSKTLNSRCQVDLIDMQAQPDGEFRFILNYQDHLTKFCILRPLKTKQIENVAMS